MTTITLLPGDGIGPEVTAATVRVLEAAGAKFEWEHHAAGAEALALHGDPLPDDVLESIVRNRVALKGPITTPVGGGFQSVNVRLRRALDLYANLRPARTLPGVPSRFSGVDLVIVRENTEGLYSGIEHEVVPGVIESLKVITEKASLRVAQYAFEYARSHGRKRVTTVHKANILKLGDGLFLDCARRTAAAYPEIRHDDRIIDNLCMQLVMRPETYDMLLLENLYGDIVSDLCAGLVGGLGVVPGANIGKVGAVFEAVHGSAPDIAGQGLANPTALLLSAVQMLRYMGLTTYAERIEQGLRFALVEGIRTRDLGGSASTREFTRAIVHGLPAPDSSLEKADAPAPSGERGGGSETVHAGSGPAGGTDSARSAAAAAADWTLRGIDIFIRHEGLPAMPVSVGKFRLTLISNRGQKVGPATDGGPPSITLVDIHRCRYVADQAVTDEDILSLLGEIGRRFAWVHIEKLHDSGGQARYSKAQGE